ncbi:MAG: hypothetical protein E6Q44_15255 [Flavobacteriales bacterium]|nr:MAG: hypothetical protein E6Q44_15255 [Flavobacteriales bacterium]
MKRKIAPWVINGLGWGTAMFVFNALIMPWVRDEPILLRHFLIGVPIWVIGGLGFGWTNQWIQQRIAAKDQQKKAMRE